MICSLIQILSCLLVSWWYSLIAVGHSQILINRYRSYRLKVMQLPIPLDYHWPYHLINRFLCLCIWIILFFRIWKIITKSEIHFILTCLRLWHALFFILVFQKLAYLNNFIVSAGLILINVELYAPFLWYNFGLSLLRFLLFYLWLSKIRHAGVQLLFNIFGVIFWHHRVDFPKLVLTWLTLQDLVEALDLSMWLTLLGFHVSCLSWIFRIIVVYWVIKFDLFFGWSVELWEYILIHHGLVAGLSRFKEWHFWAWLRWRSVAIFLCRPHFWRIRLGANTFPLRANLLRIRFLTFGDTKFNILVL